MPVHTDSAPAGNESPNRAQLAKMMGVSLPTVDDWVRRGCPVAETGGKGRSYAFNVQKVIEWRVKDERRRQGLPAVDAGGGGRPALNPLRALIYDGVKSYLRYAFCQPNVEAMVEDVQKRTGCELRDAKMVVATGFHIQWMTFAEWVVTDRFSLELQAGDEGDSLDDIVLGINPRAVFIHGPLSDDKINDGTHMPESMAELYNELLGSPQDRKSGMDDGR